LGLPVPNLEGVVLADLAIELRALLGRDPVPHRLSLACITGGSGQSEKTRTVRSCGRSLNRNTRARAPATTATPKQITITIRCERMLSGLPGATATNANNNSESSTAKKDTQQQMRILGRQVIRRVFGVGGTMGARSLITLRIQQITGSATAAGNDRRLQKSRAKSLHPPDCPAGRRSRTLRPRPCHLTNLPVSLHRFRATRNAKAACPAK
jgi:hypothetical protein